MKPATRLLMVMAAFAVLLAAASPAKADTVVVFSPSNGCGGSTCFGNVFTLTITSTGTNTWAVTLTVDTSGNTNPGTAIAAVDFKYDSGITGATLTSAPGGTAGWTTITGNLSNNGCGSNPSAFACSEDSAFQNFSVTQSASLPAPTFPTPLAPLNGATHTWTWDVTSVGPILPGSEIHIGALFGHIETGNPQGKAPGNITYEFKGNGLLSGVGTTTVVPEPGSMALFGTGLLGLAGAIRRRMKS